MAKPTLTVYGATSFTARELLRYLGNHPDGEAFNLILSGRNRAKLETAARGMKRENEVVPCDLTDLESVRDLVARSTVVINLAGPFRNHNAEALIRECAATGTHYLDLCGERFFIGKVIIPKYDYQASRTGACIIPAAGFDSIPSDMTLYLALRTLQASYPNASITSARSFFKVKATISGGSFASVKSETETPPEERERGEWVMTSLRGKTAPPRFIYESHHPSLRHPLIGGFFIMYPFNRCVVRRSWLLSRSAQAAGSKEPRHGDELVYDEAIQTRSRIMAFVTTLGLTIFGLLVFGPMWLRDLVFRLIPEPGDGATDEQLYAGRLDLTNIALTTEPGVSVVTTCKHDGDPGYIATNYMLTEAALSLILPPPKGTSLPPLASQGGVLTPSTALGMVLIERLNQSGKVVWESKVWDESKPHQD